MAPDLASPTAVTLLVVAHDGQQPGPAGWTGLVDSLQEQARHNGSTLTGPDITTLWEMPAAEYLTSMPITDAGSS